MEYKFTGSYSLIASGDFQSAGFTTAFSALASLSLHAVKRGVSESDFMREAWRAGAAVRHTKSQAKGERMAQKSYAQALVFSRSAKRGGSRAGFYRWVEESAQILHKFRAAQWRGRGSSAERKVLAALIERSLSAHDLCVNASVRLLSEETLLPRTTVAAALDRLAAAGWFTFQHASGGARMAWLQVAGVDVFEALQAVYGSETGLDVVEAVASETPAEVFDEAFARRGVNRHHGFIFSGEILSTRQVADLHGLTLVTARRHLVELEAVGLVVRVGRGRWVGCAADLVDLASRLDIAGVPTAGLRDRMRAAYEVERFHFESVQADRELGRSRKVLRLRPTAVTFEPEMIGSLNRSILVSVPSAPWVPLPLDPVSRRERAALMSAWVQAHGRDEVMLAEGRRVGILPPNRLGN